MTRSTGSDVDLLDTVPAAYMQTDLAGRIVRANELLRSWVDLGAHGESVSIMDLLTASSGLYYESVITPSLALGGELSDVVLELRVDGSVRHTVWAARRADADAVHWFGIDVTARRTHERELIAVQRRLARLQRLSSELMAVHRVDAIGDVLLEHVVDGVKADRGVVAIVRDEGGIDVVARRAIATGSLVAADLENDPLVQEAVRRREPSYATAPPGSDPERPDEATQSAALPLVSGRGLGVVLLRLSRASPYTDEEKDLLAAATHIASSSVDRAQLLQRLETVARRNVSLSMLLHAMEEQTSVRDRAQRMADLLVPEHCDLAVVDLHEAAPELAGLRHVDPSKEEVVRWLHDRTRASDVPAFGPALEREHRRPTVHVVPTDEELAAAGLNEREAAAVRFLDLASYVRIPLIARARMIGTLTLAYAEAHRHGAYDAEEFFGRLADACALSLDNARLFEHEREIAQQLQDALLPERMPTDRRFSLHRFYRAGRDIGHVGGDWYDAFLLDDDRLGLMVGDVVGGGVSAARTMGKLRTVAYAYARDGRGVEGTLAGLHRFATDVPAALASSVFYAEVSLADRTVRYGSAGHPPPVVIDPECEPRPLDGGRGPLLGLLEGDEPAVATSSLAPGSAVVMYTDGLVERRSRMVGDGIDLLLAVLRDQPELAVRPAALAGAIDSGDRTDDTCVLTLRLSEAGDAA